MEPVVWQIMSPDAQQSNTIDEYCDGIWIPVAAATPDPDFYYVRYQLRKSIGKTKLESELLRLTAEHAF